MVILLIGAPGTGKGTISNILIHKYNFKQISTGDLLREEVASGSKLGQEINEIMKSGKFVSADLVNNLVKTNIEKAKANKQNIVLDGYPRNVEQALYLATYCKIDRVFSLVVDEKLLIKRLVGRWGCPKCGAGYNINTTPEFMPGGSDGKYICRKCGAELTHRADDNEATISSRMKTFNEQTKPLITHYAPILQEIDSSTTNINGLVDDMVKSIS